MKKFLFILILFSFAYCNKTRTDTIATTENTKSIPVETSVSAVDGEKASTSTDSEIFISGLIPLETLSYGECLIYPDDYEVDMPDAFVNIPGDTNEAKTYIKNLLSSDYKDSIYLNYRLVEILLDEKEYSDALDILVDSIDNGIGYIDDSDLYLIFNYIKLSRIHIYNKDFEKAFTVNQSAERFFSGVTNRVIPEYVEGSLLFNTGKVLTKNKLYEDGLATYQKAFSIAANIAEKADWILYSAVILIADLGNDTAIKALNTAELFFPNDYFSYYYRGMYYLDKDDYVNAMEYSSLGSLFTIEGTTANDNLVSLNSFIFSKAPSDPSSYSTIIDYSLATITHSSGKYAESIKYFKKVLNANPNLSFCYLALAEAEIQLGNLDSAKNYLDALYEIRPDLSWVHLDYGKYYIELKDWANAEKHLRECMILDHDGKTYYYALYTFLNMDINGDD